MTTYSITSTAPADLTQLVEDAVRDGEVTITRDGQIVARIVAVPSEGSATQPIRRQRVFGRMKGQFVVPHDFDEPLEELRPYLKESLLPREQRSIPRLGINVACISVASLGLVGIGEWISLKFDSYVDHSHDWSQSDRTWRDRYKLRQSAMS